MPYKDIVSMLVYFVPWYGTVKTDRRVAEMKISITEILRSTVFPLISCILGLLLVLPPLVSKIEERLNNHIKYTDVHLEFKDKMKIFTTQDEIAEHKEADLIVHREILDQLKKLNQTIHEHEIAKIGQ